MRSAILTGCWALAVVTMISALDAVGDQCPGFDLATVPAAQATAMAGWLDQLGLPSGNNDETIRCERPLLGSFCVRVVGCQLAAWCGVRECRALAAFLLSSHHHSGLR